MFRAPPLLLPCPSALPGPKAGSSWGLSVRGRAGTTGSPLKPQRLGEGMDALTRPTWEARGPSTQGHPQAEHPAMLPPLSYVLQEVRGGSFNGQLESPATGFLLKATRRVTVTDTGPPAASQADRQDNPVGQGFPPATQPHIHWPHIHPATHPPSHTATGHTATRPHTHRPHTHRPHIHPAPQGRRAGALRDSPSSHHRVSRPSG